MRSLATAILLNLKEKKKKTIKNKSKRGIRKLDNYVILCV
jgi:hypothetical protein